MSARTGNETIPVFDAITLGVFLVFASVIATLISPAISFASEENEVGAEFSVEGVVYTVSTAALDDERGTVTLTDGSHHTSADVVISSVAQTVGNALYEYDVTAVDKQAFQASQTLVSIDFSGVLSDGNFTIGDSAFQGCTSLVEVRFPQKLYKIGNYAFDGCVSLAEVVFPEGTRIGPDATKEFAKTYGVAFGNYAFRNCAGLTTFTVPAVISASRYGDFYYSFDEYNTTSLFRGSELSGYTFRYVSGYQPCWHTSCIPTANNAFGTQTFAGCENLREIIFEAGADLGAYAYFFKGDSEIFEGCTSLQSFVFESFQSYYTDPNRALWNGAFVDFFDDFDAVPDLYYAIDYYATFDAESVNDGTRADGRISRVEYLRGTEVSALSASDKEVLASCIYPYAHEYADADTEKYNDGTIPDPNEAAAAAAAAGALPEYDETKTYVWKLTDTQSQREALSDSCRAYLAEANDLSAGRIESEEVTALQKRCDQNYSRWIVDGIEQDSSFDAERYYGKGVTSIESGYSRYRSTYDFASGDDTSDMWIDIGSSAELSLFSAVSFVAADGAEIDLSECTLTYQRLAYDTTTETGTLLFAEPLDVAVSMLGINGGPLLVSISPGEGSTYCGQLRVWLLVKGYQGSVIERFTASSLETWKVAPATSENITDTTTTYTSPYAVQVSSADLSSALVGVSLSGLVKAPINVVESNDESHLLSLAPHFRGSDGLITDSTNAKTFSLIGDAADYAVKVYEAVASSDGAGVRNSLGFPEDEYPWGDSALLLAQDSLHETAAAACAFSYAQAAPLFYLNEDESLSDDTLACLSGYSEVILLGTPSVFTPELVTMISSALESAEVNDDFIFSSQNSSFLSRAMAEFLISRGYASPDVVTISDAYDPFDMIGALNRSGHSGGLTLVSASSADSKLTCSYLRAYRDNVSTVRLFGREESNALTEIFGLYDSLVTIWDERGGYSAPTIASGDTIELSGVLLNLGSGSGTEEDPFVLEDKETLWGAGVLSAGVYKVGEVYCSLATDLGGSPDDDGNGDDGEGDPTPTPQGGSDDPDSDSGHADEGQSATIGSSGQDGQVSGFDSTGAEGRVSSVAAYDGGVSYTKVSSSSATQDASGFGSRSANGTPQNVSAGVGNGDSFENPDDPDSGSSVDSGVVSSVSAERSASTDDSRNDPPYAVAIAAIAALAAVGLGIWFMHRRKDAAFDDTFLNT